MIEITDEETSDVLSHLDEAVQFIEGSVFHTLNTNNIKLLSECLGEASGGVLVHCRYDSPSPRSSW